VAARAEICLTGAFWPVGVYFCPGFMVVFVRKMLGNGSLLAASVLLCLVVAEATARWLDGVPLTQLRLPEAVGAMGLDTTAQHLDEVPRAPGVDRASFFSAPPLLPNRAQRSPWTDGAGPANRYAPADFRTDFGPEDFFKAWNAAFVGDPCKSNFFSGAPGRLIVFDPPNGERRPVYHFLPNMTTPLGLVTNQFGFRGSPVEFKRRANTVRIVFVGASTTVEAHATLYSGPEMIAHWLDLWAATNRSDIKFEILNAGRESVTSSDIAAIVRQEIVPLRPDLVVYYEGANQFSMESVVKDAPTVRPAERQSGPDGIVARWLSGASRYSELARRAHALMGVVELSDGGREPPKPQYKLDWPTGVDEFDPDLSRSDLPIHLSTIVADLDKMRTDLAAADSAFAVSSFMWLVKDGMTLNPIRNRLIYDDLNVNHFPYRYRDIERLAAFQNRVFAKYAATRSLPLIDVARLMPFDPDLFADAIHNTQPGINMRAWIVFQQILPIIEKQLASGAWPKPPPPMGDTHPTFAVAPRLIMFDCKGPEGAKQNLPR
jgi:hypothetical protein